MDHLPPLTASEVAALNAHHATLPARARLRWAWDHFGTQAAIGTSFQGAGLVLMHLAKRHSLGFPLFTIDTGLLFPETLALKKRLEDFLEREIEALTPDLTVEQQAAAHGPELWRRDPDLCCTLRKVLPLRDRLSRLQAWITGLRRDQSSARSGVDLIERYALDESGNTADPGQTIIKLNPLARWPREQVWAYPREHQVPYNPLHDQGYRPIGCQPCTSKIQQGDSERAGRWIGFNKTECGIHTFLRRDS